METPPYGEAPILSGSMRFASLSRRHSYLHPNRETIRRVPPSLLNVCPGMSSFFILFPSASRAFLGCISLESIEVEDGNKSYQSADGVLFDITGVKLITYPAGSPLHNYIVPAGTVVIESGAFASASGLDSISLDKDLARIESSAFDGCTSLRTVNNRSTIYLEAGSDLGGGVAKHAENVIGYVVSTMDDDGNSYMLNVSSKTARLTVYGGDEKELSLEPTVTYMDEEYLLTSIGERAFLGSGVTKVAIPNTVSSIDDTAFFGCEDLVSFDASDSLLYIGRAAFSGCAALESIDLELGPAYIDDCAFDGSAAVKSLIFGASLQYLEEGAFSALKFMDEDSPVFPTAENLVSTIWHGNGDGIMRSCRWPAIV